MSDVWLRGFCEKDFGLQVFKAKQRNGGDSSMELGSGSSEDPTVIGPLYQTGFAGPVVLQVWTVTNGAVSDSRHGLDSMGKELSRWHSPGRAVVFDVAQWFSCGCRCVVVVENGLIVVGEISWFFVEILCVQRERSCFFLVEEDGFL